MKKLLYLPLSIFYFYTICKTSPVKVKVFKWTSLFWFMIRVRLCGIFYSSQRDVSLSFKGYKLHADDYVSLENLFTEIFVHGEYYYPKSTNPTPQLIYDCGANVGIAMVFFKILYPEVKIVSFEPNPKAFNYIKKNIESNKFKHVYPYQVALSDSNGEIDLYFDEDNLVTGSLNKERDLFDNAVKVKTVLLSDYLKEEQSVDILKIDVEGAEIQVFEDITTKNLITKTKTYMIEYHNFGDASIFQKFLSHFTQYKYQSRFIAKVNRKKDYQDIIILLQPK